MTIAPKPSPQDDTPVSVPGESGPRPEEVPNLKFNICTSLSMGVLDMEKVDFDVKDVKEFRTRIVAPTFESFVKICDGYQTGCWKHCKDAIDIALALWNAGKIKMPIIKHRLCPILVPGHHWVQSITDIRWYPMMKAGSGVVVPNKKVIIRITNQKQLLALTPKEMSAFMHSMSNPFEEKEG